MAAGRLQSRGHSFQHEDLCRSFLTELRACWSGRVLWTPPANEDETRVFEQVKNKHFLYVRVGHDERHLELRADGTIGEGAAGCERFWAINKLNGKLALTIVGDSAPTCHLHAENGVWRGNWLSYEQMPIELVPASRKT